MDVRVRAKELCVQDRAAHVDRIFLIVLFCRNFGVRYEDAEPSVEEHAIHFAEPFGNCVRQRMSVRCNARVVAKSDDPYSPRISNASMIVHNHGRLIWMFLLLLYC